VLFKAHIQHNQAQKDKLCALFPWMMELEQMSMKCPSHCNFPLFLGGEEHVQEAPLRSSSAMAYLDVHLRDLKVYLKLKKVHSKKNVFIWSKCTSVLFYLKILFLKDNLKMLIVKTAHQGK
jgi:hypothetical protein